MEKKIFLSEKEMPRAWYNIQADLPRPLPPPLNPATGEPITPDMLEAIFPMNLIEQEMSTQRFIPIPDEVMEQLLIWRPTPLCRATALERYLGTPARIYYKNEGVSPPGSHKPNTSVAQAYYNKEAGIKRLTTETGAGQWGSALAFACNRFGLRTQGLHGEGQFRSEALQAHHDGDLGRQVHTESEPGYVSGAEIP